MAIWLCRAGKHGEHEQKFLEENRIYLTWGRLDCDLASLQNRDKLRVMLKDIYPEKKQGAITQNSSQIWAFVKKMSLGDWICLPSKQKTIHIGEVTGPYVHIDGATSPYSHYREVKWLEQDIPRTNFDQDLLHSLGAFSTICEIRRNDAEKRIRAMQTNNWRSVDVKPLVSPEVEELIDTEKDIDLEQIARDQVARMIAAKFSGHAMEGLVESILEAQGFTTYHTGKGADGGVDILAAPDTLGFGQPRLCVQVKSQNSPLERPILDQLVGTMQHVGADQGLLVCWGGFKKTVKQVEAQNFFKVRLWDQNDLIDQFLANYDKLDESLQAEIPLKRMWAVASQEDSGEE